MTAVSPVLLGVLLAWALAGAVGRRAGRRAVRRRLARRARSPHRLRHRVPQRLGRRASAALAGVAVAAALVGFGPVLGAVVGTALLAPPAVHRRRQPALVVAGAVATLPDTVDLLAVAARAGLPAQAAVAAIAQRAPPPWGPALAAAVERTRRGERFGDALDELAAVGGAGDVGSPLRAVLRSAADGGGDLVTGLERLAADARDLRRRRAEEAARRVPVRLLLPLVACSLPAFALLTIVPIVAGALRALAL